MKANSVIFWKTVKRREIGANVNMRYLIRMAKIAECHDNLSKRKLSIEIIEKKISKSEDEYMIIQKTSMGM